MKVIVNGEHKEYEFDKISVLDLLRLNNVKNPDVVVVQINGNVCEKEFYSSAFVKDGDEVDFIYFVGGGQ